jgi:hypothetical protein
MISNHPRGGNIAGDTTPNDDLQGCTIYEAQRQSRVQTKTYEFRLNSRVVSRLPSSYRSRSDRVDDGLRV